MRIFLRLPALMLGALTSVVSLTAQADFSIPGYELVYTSPAETRLTAPDLREPVQVWREMFDAARDEIVLGQFYVAGRDGEALDLLIARLEAAVARGVKVRFLMEAKGQRLSEPATLARLQRIPGLDFRLLDYSKLSGNGIIHAKYFVVDRREAYVGSQNFDWRSLKHIQEAGLRITDPALVAQV
ncbi:MAG TPA: phospholipase D-like domain-containing protein, partial [Roseateles sp.]|uniref:phospholipase D-like domain-containing protein n=1 Tax=Roseateles sp. TaxID=1971397 RepID=UPI002ED9C0DD